MKITADTNFLLAATFWEGDPFRILEKVRNKEIELILSNEILTEYLKVLSYEEIQSKVKDKNLEMKNTFEEIKSMATIVSPSQKIDLVKKDPSDNKIIECALEGGADYILTRDNHLLEFKEFRGIKIINPEEFLDKGRFK